MNTPTRFRAIRHLYSGVGGFSLLEMMVVVALIGLSITIVSLSLDRDVDRVAELEARRFAALVAHVRDESILTGRSYGVRVDEHDRSYEFLVPGASPRPVERDDLLRKRRLPEYLNVRLDLPERPATDTPPMVLIQAIGDITPFVLTITGDKSDFQVSVDPAQNLKVEPRAHDAG